MKSTSKIFYAIFILLTITACNNKKPEPIVENKNFDSIVPQKAKSEESIEGLYKTQPDPNNADECEMSIEISKVKNDYFYFLKTKLRKLKGKATFTTNESGEKYLVLESIKWDDYEGDISNEDEDETDSISNQKPAHKELEIPVGIDASYVKDTLTIQNYGNSMNSYTKISECGRKYIQLIKK